jgi:hypothetical protein
MFFLRKSSVSEPVNPMHKPSILVGVIIQVYSGKTYEDITCFRDWMSPGELHSLTILRSHHTSRNHTHIYPPYLDMVFGIVA